MASNTLPLMTFRKTGLMSAAGLAALLLGLSACVAVPETSPLTPVSDLASAQSLKGGAEQWPGANWWTEFNDPQLNGLIDEAFTRSPTLQEAQARLDKARSMDARVRAALYPQASANANVTTAKQSYNNGFPAEFVPHGYLTSGRLTLDAAYDLDLWGQSHEALLYAVGTTRAAEVEAWAARQSLAQAITLSYIELGRLYVERDHVALIKRGSDKRLELLELRYERNLEPFDHIIQARDDEAQLEARLIQLDSAIALQQDLIAALVGAGPDRGLTIKRPELPELTSAELPYDAGLNLLGRRPDVVAARLRVEAAGHGVKAAKAEFYPNIRLSAYVGTQSLGLQNLFRDGSDIGGIGPAISLPLFRSGEIQSQYLSYSADYDLAVAQYNGALTKALQQVSDAAIHGRTTTSLREAADRRAANARSSYDMMSARYQKGLVTEVDVLLAHSNMVSNDMNVDNLAAQALADRVNLYVALGGGFSGPESLNTPQP